MAQTTLKLLRYLALAEEVCFTTENLAGDVNDKLLASPRPLTMRDRILTGLALKIDSSFRALIEDARAHRVEGMHHLKTMVEAFIYFNVVTADASDATALAVFAEVCYRKALFAQDNKDADLEQYGAAFQAPLDALATRGVKRIGLKNLKTLAEEHGLLKGWYSRVYRTACEPAHIADLVEFMPTRTASIEVGSARTGRLSAHVAIDMALQVELSLLSMISKGNVLGLNDLTEQLSAFRARFDAIRALATETEVP